MFSNGVRRRRCSTGRFTALAFAGRPREAGIRTSTNGRGRRWGNVFIGRLRRSLQGEAVRPREATYRPDEPMDFRNTGKPRASLGWRPPAEVYLGGYVRGRGRGATASSGSPVERETGGPNDNARSTPQTPSNERPGRSRFEFAALHARQPPLDS